jgi:DedD protein
VSDADNLDIKKRARRRLVGAVALALLAAVVLPMIMDQEPHPAIQDIQITIPDRDAAGGPRRTPLASEAQAPSAAVPVPEDDEVAAGDKTAPPPTVEAPAKPAPEVAVAPPPRAAAPVAPQPARSEPPATVRAEPESRPVAPSAEEEARVRAILSGQAVPPRGESFVIQVGAFSDAAKATRLADDLKTKGFQAYTERAGNVTRVRVGPIAGRAAADAAAARLKAAGHQAVLQPR